MFLLFIAVLLATAIEPIVNRLRRGPFSRGSGVLVVYTAIMLVIGIRPATSLSRTFLGQAGSFAQTLPERLQTVRVQASAIEQPSLRASVVNALDQVAGALQSPGQLPRTRSSRSGLLQPRRSSASSPFRAGLLLVGRARLDQTRAPAKCARPPRAER